MHRVSRKYAAHGIYVVGFDGGLDSDGNEDWCPVYWTEDRREAFDVCSFLNGGERPNLIGWLDAGEEAREYEAGLEAKTKAIDEKEERKF